ncbi:hypothetical protein SCP_0806280 [Sparassis crispa]|uniref:Retrovirus-related Pol polyprotein from transposon TNT 1-94 n=1 Tax=Sparassis crispa TaxID=139825 RepID=A0A401GWG0_9APHY|nr:hypothetical protein SCP_0806280 [Sparassis crispa]GBE86104.1 hypothetical protein SCP_0806280 [Sparassis crispa]
MVKHCFRYQQTVTVEHSSYSFTSRRLLQQQGCEVSDLHDLVPYPAPLPFAHLSRIDSSLFSPDSINISLPLSPSSSPSSSRAPSLQPIMPIPHRLPRVMTTTIAKEFSDILKLAADRSNYRIWLGHIKCATGGCDTDELLDRAADPTSDVERKLNKQMLNAITGKFHDSLFKKYLNVKKVHEVMTGLKVEFGTSTAASEAWMKAKLFSLRCSDDHKVHQHLDQLAELKEKLSEMNVKIEDCTYINAITTFIPCSFASTVTAITTAVDIFNSTLAPGAACKVVTSTEIVTTLRAEADFRSVLKSGDKTTTASAAITGGCGGGRGRGRHGYRGRGNGSSKGNVPKSDDDLTCYKCGGKGHRAPNCPLKKQYYQRSKGKSEAAASSSGSTDTKPKADGKLKDNVKDTSASTVAVQSVSSVHIEEAWSASMVFSAPLEEIVIDCADLAAQDEVQISETYHAFARVAESDHRVDIFDTGASHHMTPHLDRLSNFCTTAPHQIRATNSEIFYSHGVGDLLMRLPAINGGRHIRLKGVLHAPAMHATLISLGLLDEAGFAWLGHEGTLTISNRENDVIASIPHEDNLYSIFYDSTSLASAVELSLFKIHKWLGHVNYAYLKAMLRHDRIAGITLDPQRADKTECRTCLVAKACHALIATVHQSPLAEKFGEHLHMDVWGSASVFTIDCCKYCLTLIDDVTCWLKMPLMRVKSEAFRKYVSFEVHLQTQHGVRTKILQSDRGGEFLSANMDAHLEYAGTVQKLTVHDTPEHNGVAERTHLTIFDGMRTALAGSGLPKWLWGEALAYIVYVHNRTACHALQGKSPFEVHFGHTLDVSNLHEWGEIREPVDPDIVTGKCSLMDISIDNDEECEVVAYSVGTAASDFLEFDPHSVAEAKHRPDWLKWQEVFRTKRDACGEVTGYCVHLVTQGFTQVEGINYFSDDTFAAVCKLASVCIILSVTARNGWYTHQVDVKSAYLYGKLCDDEKIYMRPPPDIELDRISPGQLLLLLIAIYRLKQLGRHCFADAKPLSQPMDTHAHLSVNQCPVTTAEYAIMHDKPYLEALGALQYVSVTTHPDITFAVGQLTQFGRNPDIVHWNALKCVYQYLKGTADLWLVLGDSEDNNIIGYSDADGMSTEGRRAVSGYIFMLNGGTVSWSSKCQDLVTLSTTKAEYIALTYVSKEALWLRSFVIELFGNPEHPIPLHSDNQSAITLSKDNHNKINLSYCPTEDMIADILTKALPSMKSKHFTLSIGLSKV